MPGKIEVGIYFLQDEVKNNRIDRVANVLLTIQTHSVEKERVNAELTF